MTQQHKPPVGADATQISDSAYLSFTAEPGAIAEALRAVRLVNPRGGFLFAIRGNACTVSSHDGHHEAQSSFTTTAGSGEGVCVYPAEHADEFEHLASPIRFEARTNGSAFSVGYTFGDGARVTHVSVDPRGVIRTNTQGGDTSFDLDCAVLKEAIKVVRPFLAGADDQVATPQQKAIHIFRDGTLYGTDGRTACYFRSGALVAREFAAFASQLSLLDKFVKRSEGALLVSVTEGRIRVTNARGDNVGWPRNADALTQYPSLKKQDDVVAVLSMPQIGGAIRHLQSAMGREHKIRISFDPARGIRLSAANATSASIPARFTEFRPSDAITGRVNIDYLARLFPSTASDTLEFRVTLIPPGGSRREAAFLFRTIDSYTVGAHSCSVTRYAPGIDR